MSLTFGDILAENAFLVAKRLFLTVRKVQMCTFKYCHSVRSDSFVKTPKEQSTICLTSQIQNMFGSAEKQHHKTLYFNTVKTDTLWV